ncbi:unnamed protein product [Heterobilharzia americana]|nr:unnamed protein product [Heterobilharzia americana]
MINSHKLPTTLLFVISYVSVSVILLKHPVATTKDGVYVINQQRQTTTFSDNNHLSDELNRLINVEDPSLVHKTQPRQPSSHQSNQHVTSNSYDATSYDLTGDL